MKDTLKVGLLGCGNIASGVVSLLRNNAEAVARSAGRAIEIVKVVDLYPEKAKALGFCDEQYTGSVDELIASPDVDVVLELMGGADFPYECVKKAFAAGKPVVTANKDMVAKYWNEIFSETQQRQLFFGFEASVGGGIPIITPLCDTLSGNRFLKLFGILNGTTNYILTAMTAQGMAYDAALAEAQRLGYAEPDPTADVSGLDAARKLCILSALALRHRVRLEDIPLEGIEDITADDIAVAKQLSCVIKLVCYGEAKDDGVALCVRPMLVASSHPLSSVSDSFNALYLTADPLDDIMLYGSGAGAGPTASSVVGDLIRCARGCSPVSLVCPQTDGAISGITTRFCIRLCAEEQGVLQRALAVLEKAEIAVQDTVQYTQNNGDILLTTVAVDEDRLHAACREMLKIPGITQIRTLAMLPEALA